MVGGTGLYIQAFCEGIDLIPPVNQTIREDIIDQYSNKGPEWLEDQIRINDPEFFTHGEMKNPQRMMRALEVKLSTGLSILQYHSGKKTQRDFKIQKFGLQLPRNELINRIDNRIETMMLTGLLKEAEQLYTFKHLNALQTVGYRELFDYLDNLTSLDEAVEKIKINTRRYAKRQMTWFRKDETIIWKHPEDSLIPDQLL